MNVAVQALQDEDKKQRDAEEPARPFPVSQKLFPRLGLPRGSQWLQITSIQM